MSLLAKLFKTKPKELSLEERIAALESKSDPELALVAADEGDDSLREAAIKKLAFGNTLLILAKRGEPARIANCARQRIGKLLNEDQLSMAQLRADLNDNELLLTLASYSTKASQALVEEISDETLLQKFAIEASTTQARQLAAEKVSSRAMLEALYKSAKGRDKAVYKIAKTKLDVFKAQDAELAKKQAAVESICVDLERHAKKPYDHLFTKLLLKIENDWREKANEASPLLKERYQKALARCQQTLDEHAEAEAALQEKQRLDAQAVKDVSDARSAVDVAMASLYVAEELCENAEAQLKDALARQDQVVKAAKERGVELENELKAYHQAVEVANNLWLRLKQSGPFPQLLVSLRDASVEEGHKIKSELQRLLSFAENMVEPLPEVVEDAKQSIATWVQEQKERQSKIKQDIRDVAGLIRKATWAIERGYVRKARGVHKEIAEVRETLIEALPPGLVKKLEDLDEAIAKLGDWHEFAVTPKKAELVEKMHSLIGAKMEPGLLAEKIQALQNDWKTLCRGGENQDQELWEKFQAAADQAYEPCKEHFAGQAAEREANAEKRRALISQLQEYCTSNDWQNAVWKDVEQTIRVARETWQSYWPVPRKLIKPLQQEFDDIIEKIYAPMNEAYAAGKVTRERLVEQAKILSAQEGDVGGLAEMAKRLQTEWQNAERTWRKDDQGLWKEFRKYLDVIFAKRQQEFDAQNAERQAELEKAESIIGDIEALFELAGSEFFNALKNLDELKQKYKEIGELPKNKDKGINKRFFAALAEIDKKTKKEKRAYKEKAWSNWFDAVESLRALENASLSGEADAGVDTQLTSTLENSELTWPAGGLDCIKERYGKLESITETPVNERIEKLKLKCIEAEVLFDVETPNEDRERRMQYQVSQLQKGMGQSTKANEETIDKLTLDWFKVQSFDDKDYQPLYERFMKCRAEALA